MLATIDKSIIRDIFGGIIRTEFWSDGSRQHRITFESSFVLSLDILYDGCSVD